MFEELFGGVRGGKIVAMTGTGKSRIPISIPSLNPCDETYPEGVMLPEDEFTDIIDLSHIDYDKLKKIIEGFSLSDKLKKPIITAIQKRQDETETDDRISS